MTRQKLVDNALASQRRACRSEVACCLAFLPTYPWMTRKFLTLTGALLLVAGIIGFALGRQPKAKALERSLVFEQKELETNDHGFVFVRTLVSNAGPHLLEISFIREPMILGHTPEVPARFQLQPFTGVQQMFQLSHPVTAFTQLFNFHKR